MTLKAAILKTMTVLFLFLCSLGFAQDRAPQAVRPGDDPIGQMPAMYFDLEILIRKARPIAVALGWFPPRPRFSPNLYSEEVFQDCLTK
jgi:hypothetical protein